MEWPSLHRGKSKLRYMKQPAIDALLYRAKMMEDTGTARMRIADVLGVSKGFLTTHLGPASKRCSQTKMHVPMRFMIGDGDERSIHQDDS